MLQVDTFGDALLHELRAVDRGARIVADDQLGLGCTGLRQTKLLQHRPRGLDSLPHPRLGGRVRVIDGHRAPGRQEQRGPAPTDQPTAQGRDVADVGADARIVRR
jgi:hypothetical protein